jgi:GUN4-like/DnaJ domain
MKPALHYQVLELEVGASLAEIKQAYRNLAKVWHPDRFVGDAVLQQQARAKFQSINTAYEFLKSERSTVMPPQVAATGDRSETNFSTGGRLAELLNLGDFKAADLETKRLLLSFANRERDGWLSTADVLQISPQALQEIDRLWVAASNGLFGFSVQRDLWQQLGCTSSGNMHAQTISENKFGECVQWRVGGRWLSQWDDFNCDLTSPPGSLPRAYIFGLNGWWSFSKGWTGYFLLKFDEIFRQLSGDTDPNFKN